MKFTYSLNAALDASHPDLYDYDGDLWIDLAPSDKVKYLKLTLSQGGPVQANPCLEPDLNGYQWIAGDTVVIGDDEGTSKVTQNSQNYAFYRSLIDTDKNQPGVQPYTFGPAHFDVVLMLKSKDDHEDGGKHKTTLHFVFDVVHASTQTP